MNDKEKRLEQARGRLSRKQYLKDYLKELNALTNIEVIEDMLLSVVESNKIGSVPHENSYKTKILFHEKDKLLIFIGKLIKLKDDKAYLFITHSKKCGLLKLDNLKDFNINFNFNDEHAGLITIFLRDLSNELLLDYYEENGEYYLEIETYGDDWSKARVLI